jgi:sugar O-acyltransferase (sialic acid O-acetyltransferase NeuD family)
MIVRKLAILGASGHGKVVADTALQAGWDQIEFFDDAWPAPSKNRGLTILGNTNSLINSLHEFDGVVVAIGDNRVRLNKIRSLLQLGLSLPSIIHPCSYVSDDVTLEKGSVIFAGAVIQSGCMIGVGCIVNSGSTVDHDCILADGVHISPGAHLGGGVKIGERSWIGIGSSVKQCINIGMDVTIGAGAAVVKDATDGLTLVGVPAYPLEN